MKVQIELEPAMKQVAEAQARKMGYASLAAILKVLAANLAQQYHDRSPQSAIPPPNPPPPALQPTVVQQPVIPPPEQFTVWPKWTGPNIAKTDPEYYLFLIEQGDIR
jgi:hypothetical protein